MPNRAALEQRVSFARWRYSGTVVRGRSPIKVGVEVDGLQRRRSARCRFKHDVNRAVAALVANARPSRTLGDRKPLRREGDEPLLALRLRNDGADAGQRVVDRNVVDPRQFPADRSAAGPAPEHALNTFDARDADSGTDGCSTAGARRVWPSPTIARSRHNRRSSPSHPPARPSPQTSHRAAESFARDRVKRVLWRWESHARSSRCQPPFLGGHRRQRLRFRVGKDGERHGHEKCPENCCAIPHAFSNARSRVWFRRWRLNFA